MQRKPVDSNNHVIPKRHDLRHWLLHPHNITGADLIAEATRRGWEIDRQVGDHVILVRGDFPTALVIDRGTKAGGTKRSIIKILMEADHEAP